MSANVLYRKEGKGDQEMPEIKLYFPGNQVWSDRRQFRKMNN